MAVAFLPLAGTMASFTAFATRNFTTFFAGILMAAQGFPVSIAGVADFYHDFLDLLVVDSEDAAAAEQLRKTGLRVHCTQTVVRKNEDRIALAKSVLEAARQTPPLHSSTERERP